MKIIFITHYSGFYGANRSLLKLISELKEFYNIEALIILPSQGKFVSELDKEGVNYRIFKFYNWQNIKNGWLKTRTKIFLKRQIC